MAGKRTPNELGARAEAAVASALVRSGAVVYLPAFGADGRVDLVYERAGYLVRVQCKSARRVGGSLRFWTCSNTDNTPASYVGQIDEFGVYAATEGTVYLVPIGTTPSRACTLRLTPPMNRQRTGIRWAADFELGPP